MAKGVRDSDQELFGNNLRIGPKEHSRLLLTTCKCERLQKISSEFGWALVVGKSDLEHVVSGKQQAWQDTACLLPADGWTMGQRLKEKKTCKNPLANISRVAKTRRGD